MLGDDVVHRAPPVVLDLFARAVVERFELRQPPAAILAAPLKTAFRKAARAAAV